MYGLYGFLFRKLYGLYGFFSKIVRIVRISSENVRIFSKKVLATLWYKKNVDWLLSSFFFALNFRSLRILLFFWRYALRSLVFRHKSVNKSFKINLERHFWIKRKSIDDNDSKVQLSAYRRYIVWIECSRLRKVCLPTLIADVYLIVKMWGGNGQTRSNSFFPVWDMLWG